VSTCCQACVWPGAVVPASERPRARAVILNRSMSASIVENGTDPRVQAEKRGHVYPNAAERYGTRKFRRMRGKTLAS